MYEMWKKDADLVVEPNVAGFSYDCFDRAKELIALGEASVHAIMPELRLLLNIPEPATSLAALPPPVTPATSQPGIAV